jgi:LmbE family N-acetylglucosaminyl deacetylase
MKTRTIILFFALSHCFSLDSWTQSLDLPIYRGAVGLAQAMARLPLTSRVMFVAAHPDDESGGLLTYVSRGLHAKTALLTLTRGEGGQNLVSADLFEPLGLLRTGELMAADEYYGVQQYFTRAFDFGFSRSAEETLRFWNREVILSDMVRAIRKFRPDVIVSFWQGTPKDGHGHHQACGILAQEAFHVSGDSRRFPELLREGLLPWQAQRFFLTNPNTETQSVLRVNTGQYDPTLGISFQQLGAQG